MPNRSLRTATTKFACSRPAGWRRPSETIARRSSSGLPRISICGFVAHERSARRAKSCSRRRISSLPTASFSANARPARIDSTMRGGPALLADRRLGVIPVPGGGDEQDGPAARDRGDAVAHQPALGHQDAGRSGPADELVRRDEDRVLVRERPVRDVRSRVHVDREIGPGGGVVPARLRAVAVQGDRHLVDIGHDPGHVRRGGEAAQLHPPVGVAAQLVLEVLEVDPAVVVLADGDDVGDGLAPRKLVGMVLVGPDEDHRPLCCA